MLLSHLLGLEKYGSPHFAQVPRHSDRKKVFTMKRPFLATPFPPIFPAHSQASAGGLGTRSLVNGILSGMEY